MQLDELMAQLQALKERYQIPGTATVYVNDSQEGHSALEQVEFSAGGVAADPILRIILHSEDSE